MLTLFISGENAEELAGLINVVEEVRLAIVVAEVGLTIVVAEGRLTNVVKTVEGVSCVRDVVLESNCGVREDKECTDVLLWVIDGDVDIPLPRARFGYWDKGKVNNKMDAEYAGRLFMIHNSTD